MEQKMRCEKVLKSHIWVLLVALFFVLCVAMGSCTGLKYAHDLGFTNSAQANSMEFMVKVNGKVCRDLTGKAGVCATRVGLTKSVKFHQDAMTYPYEFRLECTPELEVDFSKHVEKGDSMDFEITPEQFEEVINFTCVGEVFPLDERDEQEISAGWEVHVVIFDDENYVSREIIYIKEDEGKKKLMVGRYAMSTTVCTKKECKVYKKKPAIVIKDDVVHAYSESYMMRYNEFGG